LERKGKMLNNQFEEYYVTILLRRKF